VKDWKNGKSGMYIAIHLLMCDVTDMLVCIEVEVFPERVRFFVKLKEQSDHLIEVASQDFHYVSQVV